MSKKVSRRQMLKAGMLAGAGLLVSGCGPDGASGPPVSLAQEQTPTSTPLPAQEQMPTSTPLPAQEQTPTSATLLAQEGTSTAATFLPYVAKEPTPLQPLGDRRMGSPPTAYA